jgi:hypothetical protein
MNKKQIDRPFNVIVLLQQALITGLAVLHISILTEGHLFHNHSHHEKCTEKCAVYQWEATNHADEIPTVIILSPAQTVEIVFQNSSSLLSFCSLPFHSIRAPPIAA